MTYVMTPARKAALRKAQLASARARRGKKKPTTRRIYGHDPIKRGVGVAGLAKNATPYARINKRSGTVGVNTGTIIPFTNKRISFGGYLRLENRNKNKNPIDRLQSRALNKIARPGTKAGAVRAWTSKNVTVKAPGIRANVGGAQVRLGTSRGAGATLIVRRGSHKAVQTKSKSGINAYNKRMSSVMGKKSRKQRRK